MAATVVLELDLIASTLLPVLLPLVEISQVLYAKMVVVLVKRHVQIPLSPQ